MRRLVARFALPELTECVESPLYEAETAMVPDATGIMLIEQDAEEDLKLASVQTPPGVNDTVPVGVVGVVDVSLTLAVQELSCPIVTGFGTHDTVVVVELRGTVATLTENWPLLVM
jgi:hypothetical protein